jgi:hypothetical protein
MSSLGSISLSALSTDNPPTPESKTPMGLECMLKNKKTAPKGGSFLKIICFNGFRCPMLF